MPCFVGFDFLQRGICVRGRWYPILKMDWLDGDQLDSYVQRNLGSPAVLGDLPKKWLDLLGQMCRANIAHGDLQHGNILVVNGQLKLIDYDGMWIPALAGQKSIEIGHRNYQSPRRTEADFGPWLDNFSARVIYLSVSALAARPGLWRKYNGGDECLLFRQSDFDDPNSSQLLAELESFPDVHFRTQLHEFRLSLYDDLEKIPSVDSVPAPAPVAVSVSPAEIPSWISDHVGDTAEAAPIPESRVVVSAGDVSWLVDQSQGQVSLRTLHFPSWPDRLLLLLLTLVLGGLAYSYRWAALSPLPSCALAAIGTLAWVARCRLSYRRLPDVQGRIGVQSRLKLAEETYSKAEADLQEILRRIADIHKEEPKEQQARSDKLQQIARSERENLDGALKALAQDSSQKRAQRDSLQNAETREIDDALKQAQKRHVESHLHKASIDRMMRIPGIGPGLKQRLASYGMDTAADIQRTRVSAVPGFGPQRVSAVSNWRKQVESAAAKTMPKALPPNEEQAIRARYRSTLQAIEQALLRAKDAERKQKEAIVRAHDQQRQQAEQHFTERKEALRLQQRALAKDASEKRQPLYQANYEVAVLRRQLAELPQLVRGNIFFGVV
jgi:hypothetical protein